jgi:hypothetical protein
MEVSFTTNTELGRRIKINDWLSFHRDRLLNVLYSMRDLGDESGLTSDQVRSVTGLGVSQHVDDLLQFMMEENGPKLIEVTIYGTVIITERGVRWVDESPNRGDR